MIINKPAYVHPRYILCTTLWHSYRSRTLKGHTYRSDYIEVHPDGRIIVKACDQYPYYWNGPSPRLLLPIVGHVGTPRGPVDCHTGYRVTDMPSMYHDLLYEQLDQTRFTPTRKELDMLYLEMLGNYRGRWLHYAALRLFGGIYKRLVVDRHHKFVKHCDWKGIAYLD